jgi:hypothetical protein
MAEVVNCKVRFIRPQYANLKAWMADPQNVYIARRGVVFIDGQRYPPQDSEWANPFKVKDIGREAAIHQYRTYILEKLDAGLLDLDSLRGKRLGCWCKEPGHQVPCHGDVLLELLSK